MSSSPTSSRLPSLDGWRAISILLVLGGHTGLLVSDAEQPLFRWIFNGNLGVRFFFVISGFLITWLLMNFTGAPVRKWEKAGKRKKAVGKAYQPVMAFAQSPGDRARS